MADNIKFGQDPLSRARRRDDEFQKAMFHDTRPVPPASPVAYREALATALERIPVLDPQPIKHAADKLRRDEQNNAEMVDTLVRAGYTDIPAQIDASVIRRLLGYVTPR